MSVKKLMEPAIQTLFMTYDNFHIPAITEIQKFYYNVCTNNSISSRFLFIVFLSHSSGQYLGTNSTLPLGICQSVFCDSTEDLAKLKDCVVVVGNLRIVLFKFTTKESYRGISLPNLREVSNIMIIFNITSRIWCN